MNLVAFMYIHKSLRKSKHNITFSVTDLYVPIRIKIEPKPFLILRNSKGKLVQ